VSEWGRVAEDGTVYVRTADGEREVGQWKAGTPEQGLAHFSRRYEQLATEVTLLEQRLRSGAGDPSQVAASAQRLAETLPTAHAVGDLPALSARVAVLLERTSAAVEAHKAARAEDREQAVVAKTALAEEAESLGGSSEWKTAGERLRELGNEWKKVTGVDRRTDDALWQRVAAARTRFAERRTAHFAALEQQREVSKGRKEKLVKEAEQLSTSTDWKPTADRYKQLMSDWKAAGRAPREVDDALWNAFKAAQDAFFGARNGAFSEQDEEFRGNQKVKEEILAEAEQLDPAQGYEKANARLRQLQEKWDAAGKVPRDAIKPLEARMAAVEDRVRKAADTRWAKTSDSPFVVRLREKVAELETKLERARAAGRPTGELEQQLRTQREWLSQSGAAADAPAAAPEASAPKRSTTAWVRADG
jgi:Domain of Unknown Function (DUF349)